MAAVRVGRLRIAGAVLLVAIVAFSMGWIHAQEFTFFITLESPSPLNSGHFGSALAGVGDVNQDGAPDVLVGAPGEVFDPQRAGRAHLMSGANGALLLTLQSPNEEEFGFFGRTVAPAGDLNQDGTPDVLVGAPSESPGQVQAFDQGRVYAFSGSGGGLLTLQSPTPDPVGNFGEGLASAGDLNQDGIPDIIVGAWGESPGTSPDFAGRVHVFNGANGALLFTIQSPNEEEFGEFGRSVAAAGDVNQDGVPDILVGAAHEDPGTSPFDAGRSYVFSGVGGALLRTLVSPNEESVGQFGSAVAGVGDVNQDGVPDLLIGARSENPGSSPPSAGRAYVFSGATGALLYGLASPNEAACQFSDPCGHFGEAVAGIGDADGDLVPDLLIGAPSEFETGNPFGRAYVFSGSSGALLHTLDNPPNESRFGSAVAGLGDIDGDGKGDLAVGGFSESGGFTDAYVFLSNATPVADAGPDQVIECTGPAGATVTLDGSASVDPDGDVLTYTWTEGSVVIAGPTLNAVVNVTLALGAHTITLTVDDGDGGVDTDIVGIEVGDTTPPQLAVGVGAQTLLPPNHAYHSVALDNLALSVVDVCDATLSAADVVITSVSSDEPEDSNDDGNSVNDIVVAPSCRVAQLRAERSGVGNGRVYSLHLAVVDASGNLSAATHKANVPLGSNQVAIDDGSSGGYTVLACTSGKQP